MRLFFKILIVIAGFILTTNSVYSQISDYIKNGTFIAPQMLWSTDILPPPGWSRCDEYADVTIINENLPNAREECYIQMRARSTTYYEPNVEDHLKETREYISQRLSKPLESNSYFIFSARICLNRATSFNDLIPSKEGVSYPLKIIVLGGNDSCKIERLLVTTATINDPVWKRYEYKFNTLDTAFSFIKIQVQWDIPNVQDSAYNGELLLDSVNIEKICLNTDTVAEHEVDFLGDGKTILNTETAGTLYEWIPNENLKPKTGQMTIMQYCILGKDRKPQDQYVKITKDGCPVMEKFKINLDCNILHPKTTDTLFYKYFEPVVLEADSTGYIYEWTPRRHLSNYNTWNPKLTDFEEFFSVHIQDKYYCDFYNYFNIKAECDKLVPGGTAIVFDTTLKESSKLTLMPKVGHVINCSWTPVIYLETSDVDSCNTAIVNPFNEKTYFVTVEDSFKCTHIEGFHIAVELKVPNVITPNGDGYNDLFVIPGLPDKTGIKIFDRNGSVIFSANPYIEENYWDGTEKNGKPVPAGTYWYVLNNQSAGLIKKGFILVIR